MSQTVEGHPAVPAPGTPTPVALGRTERADRKRRRSRAGRDVPAGPLTYLLLTLTALLSAFPIYWTIVVASRDNSVISKIPPPLVPGGELVNNLQRTLDNEAANFTRGLINSAIVSGTVAISTVFFASLAGFAFAKLKFAGRNVLLLIVIATLAVPVQLGIIPLYVLMAKLGWTGELKSVIVPYLVGAFGVFFMRQYIVEAIPNELIEAARIDGCTTFGVFWRVVFPVITPAGAVLGLFTFMATWNDFLWPLVTLNSDNPTVQVSLSALASGYYQDYSLVLAGTALATIPLLILFVVTGKQLIAGILEGTVKG